MNDSNKIEFSEIMVGYGEMYNKPMTKSLMRVYFSSLQDLSIQQVEYGLGMHSNDKKHGSFMPKPADIRRHIEASLPTEEESAELAWLHVEKAMSRVGAYGSLKMDDKKALAAVASLGSWKDLCHTDIDKIQWKRKQFIEAYQNFDKTPIEALPDHLSGLIEQDRASKVKPKNDFMEMLKNKMDVNNGE